MSGDAGTTNAGEPGIGHNGGPGIEEPAGCTTCSASKLDPELKRAIDRLQAGDAIRLPPGGKSGLLDYLSRMGVEYGIFRDAKGLYVTTQLDRGGVDPLRPGDKLRFHNHPSGNPALSNFQGNGDIPYVQNTSPKQRHTFLGTPDDGVMRKAIPRAEDFAKLDRFLDGLGPKDAGPLPPEPKANCETCTTDKPKSAKQIAEEAARLVGRAAQGATAGVAAMQAGEAMWNTARRAAEGLRVVSPWNDGHYYDVPSWAVGAVKRAFASDSLSAWERNARDARQLADFIAAEKAAGRPGSILEWTYAWEQAREADRRRRIAEVVERERMARDR